MQTTAKEHLTQPENQFKKIASGFVNEYVIDQHNWAHVDMLTSYFTRETSFEGDFAGQYLNKGIMLLGNVGSGKTLLMNIFQRLLFLRSGKTFLFKNLGTLSAEYKKDGDIVIFKSKRKDYLFDELGLDTEHINSFGNKINIVQELVRERYEDFINNGTLTHFTTNLVIEQIEENYGERTASRLTEMCNFIQMTSYDRRKDATPKKRQAPIKPETVGLQPEQQYEQSCIAIIAHLESVREAGRWLKFGLINNLSRIYYDFLADVGIINYSADKKTKTFQTACKQLMCAPNISEGLAHKEDWRIFRQAMQDETEIPRGNFFFKKVRDESKCELFKAFVMDVIENDKDIYKILNIQKPKEQ